MGRPASGLIAFDDAILASLPKEGTVPEVARLLGVTDTTMRTWLRLGAPFLKRGTAYTILRAPFIAWLKKCQRYRASPILDYTQQVKLLGPEAQAFLQTCRQNKKINLQRDNEKDCDTWER